LPVPQYIKEVEREDGRITGDNKIPELDWYRVIKEKLRPS